MSKTIKNVKLTTRQWELLVNAIAFHETVIEDRIRDEWEGYSHKTLEAHYEMRHKLEAYL
ncbi:MAG: hypothetical protein CL440_06755 [Acidimicrobiaceae bacterium]|nr:hypothetical protein [Acidimicrobiaceae bacterium]